MHPEKGQKLLLVIDCTCNNRRDECDMKLMDLHGTCECHDPHSRIK